MEEVKMFVKFSLLTREEVIEAVSQAICDTRWEGGSHDATGLRVAVDGAEVPLWEDHGHHTSIQRSSYWDHSVPAPAVETVRTALADSAFVEAAVWYAKHHYGGNSRSRWGVRVYTQSGAIGGTWGYGRDQWFCADIQEVSDAESRPFLPIGKVPAVVAAVAHAEKRVRVKPDFSDGSLPGWPLDLVDLARRLPEFRAKLADLARIFDAAYRPFEEAKFLLAREMRIAWELLPGILPQPLAGVLATAVEAAKETAR